MSSMQKKSLIATAAIFCCRFTGLLREIVYTSLFGATGALDAFLTAFRVPNMLRDMFAEGALSQSFTSVMSKVEKQEGAQAAWGLANRVSTQLISLMICIVSAGILLAGVFMQQLYPERARVVLHTPWGAPTMLCADAAYRGTRTNADGMKEVLFEATEKIEGLTPESCLRLSVVEKLEHGQKIALTCAAENVPAGVTRIEPRSFMALATDLCRIIWPFILLASVSALCMGVFSQNKGTIKDLGLENVNISFNVDSSWGIDGFGALAGYNEGKIIDCYATGSISLTGEAVDTAGLVGWNAEGSFERCYAAVNVTVNSGYDSVACGGLVGRNSGSVKNCYATGNVSVNARNAHAGGLVGEIGGNYAEVVNCYATGNAVANGKYTTAGGLVGWGYNIKNCFATGSVSSYASGNANSQAHAGGAVGKTNMSTSDYEKVYSPEGQSISASDNQNTAPIETVTTAESLKSAAFLKDTLGFSEELWTIADGAYPTLK